MTLDKIVNEFKEFTILSNPEVCKKYGGLGICFIPYRTILFDHTFGGELFIPAILHELCHAISPRFEDGFIYGAGYYTEDPSMGYSLLQDIISYDLSHSFKPYSFIEIQRWVPEMLKEECITCLASSILFEVFNLKHYYTSSEARAISGYFGNKYQYSDLIYQAWKDLDYMQIQQKATQRVEYLIPRLEKLFS
jgi:hypothetical protein